MDRRQRFAEPVEQFRSAFEGMQSDLWTALPGRIESVDFDKMTVSVQPTIMAQFTGKDDVQQWVELPLLLDCPVVFPSGGGFTLTFPLAAGDECLVIFASRCIDNWWAQQGDAGASGASHSQAEQRMHSLSDGFCIPGPRNTSRLVSDINQSAVELRQDAGTAVISILDSSEIYIHSDADVVVDSDGSVSVRAGGDVSVAATSTATVTASVINATATTSATLTAPTIGLSGATTLTGAVSILGSLSVNGKDFTTHIHLPGAYHIGASSVTGDSGAPV